MKFLIHSDSGYGAGLAWKLQEEGHHVSLFIKGSFYKPILAGIVPKVASIEEGLSKKPDVVLFDVTGDGKLADDIRKQKYRVVGGGAFCDLIEMDRSFAMNLAKKVGIKVPEFTVFKQDRVKEAVSFIEETGRRYVLKPDGDHALELTYVSKDPGDMIQMLEWAEKKKILKGDFLLQEFIEGVEISTEMWFSEGNLLPELCNGTIEQKKFMTGDLGQNTSCESSIVWPYESPQSKIVQQTVGKIAPIIKKYGYTGPIDVNAIVKDGQAYFLEFTPRFGYSAIYALAELIDSELGEFFYKLASRDTAELSLKKEVSMALTVSLPPYPLDSSKKENQDAFRNQVGKRIFEPPKDGFWPFDVKSDGEELICAGTSGLISYITASGTTVEKAEDKTYGKVEGMSVPDGQYRMDGAIRAEKDIPSLKNQGYEVPPLVFPGDQEIGEETEKGGI